MELLSALVTVLLLTAVYYHGKSLAEKRRGDNLKHQLQRSNNKRYKLMANVDSFLIKIDSEIFDARDHN